LIRVLLDQGLPHSSLSFLHSAGWDAVHVLDIGMQRAIDPAIIDLHVQIAGLSARSMPIFTPCLRHRVVANLR
jgi:hypothetical protein